MEQSLIQLVIAWTLVGAFVFSVIITCASLVGWIKITDRAQQRKLFYILIVQLLTFGVTYFGKVLNYSPTVAINDIKRLTTYDYWKSFHHKGVIGIDKPNDFPDEYVYQFEGVEGRIKYYPDWNVYVESNERKDAPTYYYYFRPVGRDGEFLYVYDDSRAFVLKLPLKSGMAYLSTQGGNGPYGEFHIVTVM